MQPKQKRPKFLNLFKIHLPVTGVNSFAHRVSGALMFLAIPGLIYLFALSVRDSQGYARALALLDTVWVKLICSVLAWSIDACVCVCVCYAYTCGFGMSSRVQWH